jgi:hypothetical protein
VASKVGTKRFLSTDFLIASRCALSSGLANSYQTNDQVSSQKMISKDRKTKEQMEMNAKNVLRESLLRAV